MPCATCRGSESSFRSRQAHPGPDRTRRDLCELGNISVAAGSASAVHGMLRSALWILLIVLAVYLVGRLIDRYFIELSADKRRLVTLRAVVWFAVQAVGVLLIAFVVFGMPSQTPTVLGLAGAGLTVALKDFIVGFVGWFVLMGRNGIRVGDWVEINGVGGEVVEISLLRTTLLETGNWTDSGHPTGRKVTFVNSFAIEGHYFNFSTSGQWLWDELTVSVPSGQNPYPVIEAIQKLVVKETEANTHTAEEEWQKATTQYRVQNFPPSPRSTCVPPAAEWKCTSATSPAHRIANPPVPVCTKPSCNSCTAKKRNPPPAEEA